MRQQLKEIMKRVFEIESISDEISQSSCENWDSLKHLNLIVEIEEELDLLFEPEEIAQMKSLNRIIEIIDNKKM